MASGSLHIVLEHHQQLVIGQGGAVVFININFQHLNTILVNYKVITRSVKSLLPLISSTSKISKKGSY